MKRGSFALAFALLVGLTLWPGATWAHHRHRAFVGCCVFISPGDPFVHHPFVFHRHFIHHGFFPPPVGSTVIVVEPVPHRVWVPGFWRWDGFQWVLVPGHWAFTGQSLLLRNPCD